MFTIVSKGKTYKYRTLVAAKAAAQEIFEVTGVVVGIGAGNGFMGATSKLVAKIAKLQGIQKENRMDSEAWMQASAELAPLFEEMAKRQARNNGEPDWKKWWTI